jgi:SAM-dependent methyltransferase
MTMHPADGQLSAEMTNYFNEQFNGSNAEYWRRLGGVDFSGKAVLDIGCGHGALSVHAAQRGAKRVVGVDIDTARTQFARENVKVNFPEHASTIWFHNGPLDEVREKFDIAISKDSFEHIEDLSGMLHSIADRLNDGGLLLTGFSPLYFSPFGDHGRYWSGKRRIPWLPAILPESILFRLATYRRREPIRSAGDVGLNKLTPEAFRAMVRDQGWEVVAWHTNRGDKPGMRVMRKLSQLPKMEKYFTVSIYAQLRKPYHATNATS